ncbi:MAG: efflux RND transporter periplasmic adaptor subunit [Puniceicoccales bacterium]|jgi:multidrug efflux system membrane fusion protein|nr:efflux RND transporter periplasmic adaptor subunit [Puniceicoccales bacterium]
MERFFPCVCAALLGLAAGGCRRVEPPAPERVVPVQILLAESRRIPIYVDAVGICSASGSVDILPQVGGQIVAEHVQSGAPVCKGQLLFSIDPRPYEAQLMQARGQLRDAEARLTVDRLRLERSQPLVPCGHISQQDYDALQADVEQDIARVESARGALQQAEIQLDFCSIRAPISGQAGYSQTDLGAVVSAGAGGQPLVNIRRLDPIFVDFSVSENVLPQLQRHFREGGGLDCTVTAMGDASLLAPARLDVVDNCVDRRSGAVHLRATMANGDGLFWPGAAVRVRVVLTQLDGAIPIPETAVGTGDRGCYVFVVSPDGRAEVRPVVVGQGHGRDVAILQGLRPGDRVVTEGQFLLAPGTRVALAGGAPAKE